MRWARTLAHTRARKTHIFLSEFDTLKWVVLTKYIIAVCYRNSVTVHRQIFICCLLACLFDAVCTIRALPFSLRFFFSPLFCTSSSLSFSQKHIHWKWAQKKRPERKPTGWRNHRWSVAHFLKCSVEVSPLRYNRYTWTRCKCTNEKRKSFFLFSFLVVINLCVYPSSCLRKRLLSRAI